MTREEKAYNYASKKNPSKYTVGEIAKHYDDGYADGYKDAVDKVCELIFEYNKRQAKKFGAKSMMRLPDYTINVGDFRKAMEEQQ